MQDLPVFPLFPDPIREKVFEPSREPCAVCGQARGTLYTGPQYGVGGRINVCPWCIADGSAGKKGRSFNDELRFFDSSLKPLVPADDAVLVNFRTPGYTTWQGNQWLHCCGRAAIYLGEADTEDLRGRWASAVPSLWNDAKPGWAEKDKDGFIDRIERGGSPAVYVFKCQVCSKLQAYWDCD